MMTTMDRPERSRVVPLRIATRAAVAAAPLGFVLAASKNPHTDGAGSVLLVLVASLVGVLAARRLPANRALAVVGAAVATTAAWLLPQRDDVGSALILAVLTLFGGAYDLSADRLWVNSLFPAGHEALPALSAS